MIGYLNGTIKFIFENEIILEVNGIGYSVITNTKNLEVNTVAEFFIHTSIKDEAINLYGFKTREAFDIFKILLTVSGVGEKSAIGILKKISPQALAAAVVNQDLQTLTKLPGIGKKSAERILFELKDKLKNLETVSVAQSSSASSDAMEALSAFGYTESEILSVIRNAPQNSTTEQLIKFALKELSKFA